MRYSEIILIAVLLGIIIASLILNHERTKNMQFEFDNCMAEGKAPGWSQDPKDYWNPIKCN